MVTINEIIALAERAKNSGINRIYCHHTGGLYKMNSVEKEHYHICIESDGTVRINGELTDYKDHTSQEGWTPTSVPSLFAKVLTSEGEILEWEQPSSTNPYMKGDKVKYNGKIYESVIDNNVWSPDGYPAGWKLVEE